MAAILDPSRPAAEAGPRRGDRAARPGCGPHRAPARRLLPGPLPAHVEGRDLRRAVALYRLVSPRPGARRTASGSAVFHPRRHPAASPVRLLRRRGTRGAGPARGGGAEEAPRQPEVPPLQQQLPDERLQRRAQPRRLAGRQEPQAHRLQRRPRLPALEQQPADAVAATGLAVLVPRLLEQRQIGEEGVKATGRRRSHGESSYRSRALRGAGLSERGSAGGTASRGWRRRSAAARWRARRCCSARAGARARATAACR